MTYTAAAFASSLNVVSDPIGFDLKTGNFTSVDAYKALVLSELCPDVGIDAALNRAAIWLLCNSRKRPADSFGLLNFITAWLQREQSQAERALVTA